jgi:transcriptional regulator with GAF, ATPase, and Fis domain
MSMSDELRQRTTAVPSQRPARTDRMATAELRVVMPPALAATIPLSAERLVLGRQAEQPGTPEIGDVSVSRKHLAIEWDAAGGFHTGVDLGSSNGSFVDSVRAVSRLPLADGSVVRLGPTVVAIYQSPAVADGDDTTLTSRDAIPGQAPATRSLRVAVARVAADPSPVLFIGETGTGKEHIAEEIHRLSGRKGDLVAVNCAALSPALVESQLFGHVRGAFTGASDAQPGLFREADGGTLFLDEIGELPLDLQPKLLRAIQEREVRPVGSTRSFAVDVRVIAATNRNLARQVQEGSFRRDLYGRLSLWEITVPPLRRRRGDLFMWIERLRRRWLSERSRAAPAQDWVFEAPAAEALLMREWRDNLRGVDRLVHALAGAAAPGVQSDSEPFTFGALPSWLWEPASIETAETHHTPVPATPARPAPNREELIAALAQHQGSVRATARYYERDRRQIYRWMESFGLKER